MANADRVLNRTERLFALVLLLQTRPSMSSRDLAEHFGVSRRTIFRDLRALAESGVPLTYADGGGYEILEGYQLPPLMITAREAATLLIGAEFMKLQPDVSLRKDADQVALKIQHVLPAEVARYVERLRDSTVIDPFLIANAAPTDEEGRWYELSEAVARRRSTMMEYYVPSRDEVTRRTVDPLGLVYYSDHWNLIAYDHLRKDIRNFRLDNIRWMRVLTEHFTPPEGFDLQEHLEERGQSLTNRRIVIRFEPKAYRWARRSIPAQVEEERELKDGRVEATFYFENLPYIARWLLRYGGDAEAVEPAELRERVADLAFSLLAVYK
jgi:predicted DNA-binding transcriptional regulator YafY